MNRILVIRGGAIGDFILTLPALKALREAHHRAHIEILGYKHIAALAENRFYAQAVRSIEYGPLSNFFAKDSELSTELANYFASFDLILSYLYDPDGIFENNLRRCSVGKFVRGPAKIGNHQHAARQLTKPIENLGLEVSDVVPKLYPSDEDRQFARKFLEDCPLPIVAFHPGSGSEKKNWPPSNWIDAGNYLLNLKDFDGSILVVSGEADLNQVTELKRIWKSPRVHFANNLSLPRLASILENAIFVGHDSGISHLAGAAGADCILLFGPTDPDIWAPLNDNVQVIRAPSRRMEDVDLAAVRDALDQALIRIGMST